MYIEISNDKPIEEQIGKLIKLRRIELDITRKELCEKIGCSQNTLYYIENSKKKSYSFITILKIFQHLKIEIILNTI